MELERDDISTLLEALDAWVEKDFGSQVIGDLFMLTFSKTPEEKEQAKAECLARKVEYERKRHLRKEQGITLQAKLLALRDRLEAAGRL